MSTLEQFNLFIGLTYLFGIILGSVAALKFKSYFEHKNNKRLLLSLFFSGFSFLFICLPAISNHFFPSMSEQIHSAVALGNTKG